MRYVDSASYIRFKSKNDITIIFILSCMHFIVSRVEFSSNYLGINTIYISTRCHSLFRSQSHQQ